MLAARFVEHYLQIGLPRSKSSSLVRPPAAAPAAPPRMAPVTRLPPVTALTAAPPAAPSPAPLSARSVVELPQAAAVAKIKLATAKFTVVLINKTSFGATCERRSPAPRYFGGSFMPPGHIRGLNRTACANVR